jgi:hypothetical protein
MDDEPLGRRAQETKRVARDERQPHGVIGRIEYPDVLRCNHDQAANAITEGAAPGHQAHFVADAQLLERPEHGVAVASDRRVSFLPGKRRIWQVAGAEAQRPFVIAFEHGSRETDAGNLEHTDERVVAPMARPFPTYGTAPRLLGAPA